MKNIYLKNLDINILSGELVGVIGPNGCGKTNILKMISGKINNNDFFINHKNVNEYDLDYKRKNIVCVFNDNIYRTNRVKSELVYYLKLLNLNGIEIDNRVNNFISYFGINELLEKEFIDLSHENRIFIKILSLLIINPKLFCIDDLMTYLKKEKKNKLLNYIKEKDITLFNITSNMEELILFDKILVLNKGEKVKYDITENILNNEEIFNKLGLSLPFIYDINNMLKSYGLIDRDHLVYKELVDVLWK